MSKVDKLLQNIFEYKNLLSFLNKNHPQVLEEWKIFVVDKNSHWATHPATGQLSNKNQSNVRRDNC
ncbi:MAG: hypothetical protein ACRD93_03845 [Nitrososphaeraceae archaeon]